MLDNTQGKVQEVGGQFHTVRKNLIPSALARIQEGLHGAVESMNKQADKMEVLNGELHAAGGHIKNVGRIFRGKEREKVEPQATDRGITAKIRKSFLTISGRLQYGADYGQYEETSGTVRAEGGKETVRESGTKKAERGKENGSPVAGSGQTAGKRIRR